MQRRLGPPADVSGQQGRVAPTGERTGAPIHHEPSQYTGAKKGSWKLAKVRQENRKSTKVRQESTAEDNPILQPQRSSKEIREKPTSRRLERGSVVWAVRVLRGGCDARPATAGTLLQLRRNSHETGIGNCHAHLHVLGTTPRCK